MRSITAPFELYHIFIEHRIDKTRAKAAMNAFLTRKCGEEKLQVGHKGGLMNDT